eukprot:1506562-Amphidinium_carterae.1
MGFCLGLVHSMHRHGSTVTEAGQPPSWLEPCSKEVGQTFQCTPPVRWAEVLQLAREVKAVKP